MWQVLGENWFWLALQVLLVALSGFSSATETALFSLTPEDRVQIGRRDSIFSRAALRLYKDREQLIVSLLTFNMFVNVGYFTLGHSLSLMLANRIQAEGWMSYTWAWSAMQFILLQGLLLFGEVLPKLFAVRLNRAVAEATSLPFFALHRGLVIIGANHLLQGVTRLVERLLPVGSATEHGLDADELREAVNRTAGLTNEEKQRMRALFSLSMLKVSAILTPRVDVLFARVGMTIEQALDFAVLHALRVLPVKGASSDEIPGVVYIHDLLSHKDRTQKIDGIVRPCMFFPEVASVESFIVAMRESHSNFAIIVDEFGSTAGVASLDDAIELVLGEFEDEYAAASIGWQEQQGRIRIDGSCPLHKFRERLEHRGTLADIDWSQMDIPDIDTVGGFVQHKTGRTPEVGQSIFWHNLVFRVLRVSNNRIRLLEVRLPGAAASGRYKSQAFGVPGGRS